MIGMVNVKSLSLIFFVLITTLSCNSQSYLIEMDGRKYQGVVDEDEKDRVNFYFDRLTNETTIKLSIPEIDSKLNKEQVEGCFRNLKGELLQCKTFDIENGVILLNGIDYPALMGDRLAIRLYFEFISPTFFVLIDKK